MYSRWMDVFSHLLLFSPMCPVSFFFFFKFLQKFLPSVRSIYINEYFNNFFLFSYVCDFFWNLRRWILKRGLHSNLNMMELKMILMLYQWSPIFIIIIKYDMKYIWLVEWWTIDNMTEKRNEDIVCTYVIIIINGSTHLAAPTLYSTLMTAHTIKNMCGSLFIDHR